jgi:CRISPR-associated endonuclease/helicase Cas3
MKELKIRDYALSFRNYLIRQGENLDELTKNSHENKPLMVHVEECWNICREILDKVGISEDEIRNFCFSLCVAHDFGKLDEKWGVEQEKRVKHSERGGALLLKIEKELRNLLPLPNGYEAPLILATLCHHSSLHIKGEGLTRPMRHFLSSRGIPLAINIADAIGVFKLADIISASNSDHNQVIKQYDWDQNFDNKICEGIERKADRKCKFDIEKYKIQNEIASSQKKHLALIAPTGWGKTAVALLRARNIKPKKILYVLPTITAIREFEKDLEEIFGKEWIGEYFYFSDVEDLIRRQGKEEGLEYVTNLQRYFIPKITITTIDQLLLTTLQFGKYHIRRFNLRDALIVFDEFHLFTPEMVGALIGTFENLANLYNFSILLMSATPRNTYLKALEQALGEQLQIYKNEDLYGRLKRHNIKIVDKDLLSFVQETKDMLEKKTLVIVNTVKKAQQVYSLLSEVNDRRVGLIHGLFTYKDRREKEENLKDVDILVSTQVAEVSLDISFKVLVTETAPLPSLIQRFGRVNRYNEHWIEGKNVYICSADDEKPYSLAEFLATKEILYDLENPQIEGEKIYFKIINKYESNLPEEETERINHMRNQVKRELDRNNFFYCFMENKRISEILGKEPECLAVPYCYAEKVRRLWEDIHRKKKYEDRKELIAQMKQYYISVPLYMIREDSEWNDDLNVYTVGGKKYTYAPNKGLFEAS